jgi:hypothetical protein
MIPISLGRFGDDRREDAGIFLHSRLVENCAHGISVRCLGQDRAGEMRLTRFLHNDPVTIEESEGLLPRVQPGDRYAPRNDRGRNDSSQDGHALDDDRCGKLVGDVGEHPSSKDVLGRKAKQDLTYCLVVQYASLALLRDRVDVAQPPLERIFLEHRHRAAVVIQRIDDLP